MRVFKRVLLAVVLLYGGAIVYLVTQETRLVFKTGNPLGAARPRSGWEQVDLPRSDGARQFAWVMNHADDGSIRRPWVLYLHGNEATIGSRMNVRPSAFLTYMGLFFAAFAYAAACCMRLWTLRCPSLNCRLLKSGL